MSKNSLRACRTQTTCPRGMDQRLAVGRLGAEEQDAADKAAVHADTPSVTHADSLGRTFLTIAHNKFERNGTMLEEKYATRVELDIEGNSARSSTPTSRSRHALRLRHARHPHPSGEHGSGRALDAERRDRQADPRLGQPRAHRFRTTYDPLRRPTDSFLQRRAHGPETLIGKPSMARVSPTQRPRTCAASVFQVFDKRGVVTSEDLRLQGQSAAQPAPIRSRLQGDCSTGRPIPCWSRRPSPAARTYDALNRPTSVTAPDDSVYRPDLQ